MGGMMGGTGFGTFGSFGLLGMILNLVITVGVIVGIVVLVVWAVRRLSSEGISGPGARSQSAKEVLQLRFARGEITSEQYKEILAELS